MTDDEKTEIVQKVLDDIKSNATYINQLPAMSDLHNTTSIPTVAPDGTLQTAPIGDVATAKDDANTAAANAVAATKALYEAVGAYGADNAVAGIARVDGSADPAPASGYIYGSPTTISNIGKHIHLGIVKNGKVVKTSVGGRLTLAKDGSTIAIDGSEGDVMLFTDMDLELQRVHQAVDGNTMNMMGVGMVKSYWQGVISKTIKPFAFSPHYTINCQLSDDARTCAHSIYNSSVAGTYSAPNGLFSETVKASGAGYPSNYVSGLQSIQMAQNKNTDALTNRPYMGWYGGYYELMLALMYAECRTVNTTDMSIMGEGCTCMTTPSDDNFFDKAISGNSGFKIILSGGTTSYQNLWNGAARTSAGGGNLQLVKGFCGFGFGLTEMLETQRVLDGINAAGLIPYIGTHNAIFYYDDANSVWKVSADGSIDPSDGTGMTAGKRYYVVRDVPNCEGMSDGVMTAVLNRYIKFDFVNGSFMTDGTTSLTGARCIMKTSHSVYRGMSIPMDGSFKQMCGEHYRISCDADGVITNDFLCASDVNNLPPLKDFGNGSFYGALESTLGIEKGLDLIIKNVPTDGWFAKANYGISLFAGTSNGGNAHTYECMFHWNNHIWGAGNANGQPIAGYKGISASVAGCSAFYDSPSARTLNGNNALSHGADVYCGAFAVPALTV